MSKHNILMVTFSYSPRISPRAFRWSAIAEHWVKQGQHVDVLSSWRPELLESENLNGVCVYRTGGKIIESLRRRFGIKKSPQKKSGMRAPSMSLSWRHKAAQFVKWIHDGTWKKVYWPDYACLWYFSAVKKTEELFVQNHYDGLITVSIPFTSHLVGLNLKKKFPHIKWLVDIGDPFAFAAEMPMNNFNLYKKLNYMSERSVFKQANCITVTNERTVEKYVEFLGEHTRPKIHIIGPLVDLDPIDFKSPILKNTDEFSLLFAGNLLNPVRNPKIFLSWVVRLINACRKKNLRIFFEIYGDPVSELQKYLPENKVIDGLRIHGKVNKIEIASALKHADILVNCGNITDYQLPSKIYEYMATGKPIINFILNPKDVSLHAMEDYSNYLNVIAGVTDIHSVVEFIKSRVHHPILEKQERCMQVLKSHSVSSISDQYLEVLN